MYFEPSKKTYYRFPSTKSIDKMDKHMYFPEKPGHDRYDTHHDHPSFSHMPEREHGNDFK